MPARARVQTAPTTSALRAEIAASAAFYREAAIDQFASNLEIARLVFRAHPRLVKSREFPEPYRTAIAKLYGYDPANTTHLDIDDLHITNPAKAAREWAKRARRSLRERAEKRPVASVTNR